MQSQIKKDHNFDIQEVKHLIPYLEQKNRLYFFVLFLLLIILFLSSLIFGSYSLSIKEVWQTIMGRETSELAQMIVWEFRMPRTIAAGIAGALFALSGAILQYITRNPLADPSLVGVSQGASLAMVISIVLIPEFNYIYKPIIAMMGALISALIIQIVSAGKTEESSIRFILTGVGIAAFIGAIMSTIMTYGQIQKVQAALNWLAGSVYAARWKEVQILAFALICALPFLIIFSKSMAAMRLGLEVSIGLGVAVKRAKFVLMILAILLAAFGVSVVGPIAFVGLIAPHLASRLFKTNIRIHLLLTAMMGALIVVMSDFIGRTAFAPFQIPAGIVTILIGVPFFIIIMLKRLKNFS